MSISNHIPDNIKRVSKSLGYALWIGSRDQWFGVIKILRARLTTEQRATLAFVLLKSLDHQTACLTADAALGQPFDEEEAA